MTVLTKRATCHTFRHSFAAHRLGGDEDFRTVQEQMTLFIKPQYEERLLMERFPEYEAYRRQTKRLIPFVW